MYRLTPNMLQRLKSDLVKYHEMFTAQRCSAWELEELIVTAIKSDNRAQHHVRWKEAGHDDEADITVRTNGTEHPIQIKSGKFHANKLTLSGHRLGRYKGDMNQITDYLNAPVANIIAVPYRQINDAHGRQHAYKVCYINKTTMAGINAADWKKHGAQWRQTNPAGVEFSLRPSMSWQIWWSIPDDSIEVVDEFAIG